MVILPNIRPVSCSLRIAASKGTGAAPYQEYSPAINKCGLSVCRVGRHLQEADVAVYYVEVNNTRVNGGIDNQRTFHNLVQKRLQHGNVKRKIVCRACGLYRNFLISHGAEATGRFCAGG